MTNTIQIQIKSVYGTDQAYPACPAARTFAEIAGSKTLTPGTLTKIRRLGYTIDVVAFNGTVIGQLAA